MGTLSNDLKADIIQRFNDADPAEITHDAEGACTLTAQALDDLAEIAFSALETTLETAANAISEANSGLQFIRRLANEDGRIVSTKALTPLQIAEANAAGRLWVDPATACGFVFLEWDLTTQQDRAREMAYASRNGLLV